MSFARFIRGGFEDASFLPDTVREGVVTEEEELTFDIEELDELAAGVDAPDNVEGDNVPGVHRKVSKEGLPETHSKGSPDTSRKRKGDVGPSDPKLKKRSKGLKGITLREPGSGECKLRDEDEEENFAPGRGKNVKGLSRLPGYNSKDFREVLDVTSSEEEGSVTGKFRKKGDSTDFGDAPVQSPSHSLAGGAEGFFVPPFTKIKHRSMLDSEDEREDFVKNVMVPGKIREMSMMTNGAFQDYSNDALIRMMCVQSEHLRRFRSVDDDRHRLLRENQKLRKKLEMSEEGREGGSSRKAAREQEFEDLRTALLFKDKEKENMEIEMVSLRTKLETLDGVIREKDEWKSKCEELEDKVGKLGHDLAEAAEREGMMKASSDELEDRVASLSKELDKVEEDRRRLIIEGLPKVVRKLLKSYEFAREMGEVQNFAVGYGGHLTLEKIHARFPKLDVTKFPGYNPRAFQELTSAGSRFEEKDFPYIVRLASSSDLPADEWIQLEPEPFPEEGT